MCRFVSSEVGIISQNSYLTQSKWSCRMKFCSSGWSSECIVSIVLWGLYITFDYIYNHRIVDQNVKSFFFLICYICFPSRWYWPFITVCCVQELRERVLRGKYRVPFYMSTDCEGILRRFLVLNPSKRCSLEVGGGGLNVQNDNTSIFQTVKWKTSLYLFSPANNER